MQGKGCRTGWGILHPANTGSEEQRARGEACGQVIAVQPEGKRLLAFNRNSTGRIMVQRFNKKAVRLVSFSFL
jgi:hypothetical protein